MSSRQLKLEASYDVEAGEATEDKFVMVVRRTNFYIQHNRKKFRSCDDDDDALVMMCPTERKVGCASFCPIEDENSHN